MDELVKAVRKHALEHYNEGGWDYVVECWDDKDILEVLCEDRCINIAQAITAVGSRVKVLDSVRRDIQGEIF